MKIMIFGGGAVGLGIASCLLKTGKDLSIIARENTVNTLQYKGLIRKGIFGEYHAEPHSFTCSTSLADLEADIYDYILVATKSSDTHSTAKELAAHPSLFDKNTKIVLFQNGWSNAEKFYSFFPEEQIFNARVITGFERPEKNVVNVTVHADTVKVGSLVTSNLSSLQLLCDSINDGGIPCEVSNSIEKDLWGKMLYNCALNPLGAIFNVPYGRLGESDHSRTIMKDIVKEVFLVMEKAGYSTHWNSPDEYLSTFYEKLLPPTAKHESSMLQDIRAGKGTEIDALNGAIVKLGEDMNIPLSINTVICHIIKFIEDGLNNNVSA